MVNADECGDIEQSLFAEGALGFTVKFVIDAMVRWLAKEHWSGAIARDSRASRVSMGEAQRCR